MWKFKRYVSREASGSMNSGVDESLKVLVYEDEAERIAKLTLQYPNLETGGSLFGYWTHSGSPVISFASDPGRGSRHNQTSFFQNETYLYNLGTKLYDQHGMQHVGEWHSHHQMGLNSPSDGDVNTIISGMTDRGWSRFLLLITTIEGIGDSLVFENFFLFTIQRTKPQPLRILTLPGSSPFRNDTITDREVLLPPAHRVVWRPGPLTPGFRKKAEELFPKAWYTKPEGRAYLVKVVQDFRAVGIECRIILNRLSGEVKLELGETELLLGPRFPDIPPKWAGKKPIAYRQPWSASADIVQWYLRSREPASTINKNDDGGNNDSVL